VKFSIITLTFNSAQTIVNCLNSINSNIHPDFEIEHIIVDGFSSDSTVSLIRNYSPSSVVFFRMPRGIYDALNFGISRCSGDVISILHSDDVFVDAHVLSSIKEEFERQPSADLIIGNVAYISPKVFNSTVRIYKSSRFRLWMFRFGFMPAHTASFIKKSVYDYHGLYRTDFVSAGDFDFFVRTLLLSKVPYFYTDRTIVNMRTGGMSSSGFQSYYRTSIELLRSLRENGVYSNWVFVLLRLPVKLISQLFSLLKSFGSH